MFASLAWAVALNLSLNVNSVLGEPMNPMNKQVRLRVP